MAAVGAMLQGQAADAQCASGIAMATGRSAFIASAGTTGPLKDHIGGTCTSGIPTGAASNCVYAITPSFRSLHATWPMSTIRLADANGGCNFMCQTGNCFVGNDGLPVELLRFGIE